MPPYEPLYQYQPYHNPYVQQIAQAMMAPGQIEAQKATAIAQAQAQAAQQSGQAWGQAAQGIGQTANSAIQQQFDPKRQFEAMQLADARGKVQAQQFLDKSLQPYAPVGPQPEGEGPAPAQHPFLDDQGLVDPQKVNQLLIDHGYAHYAPDLIGSINTQNEHMLAYKKTQEDLKLKQTLAVGTMANTALHLMDDFGIPFDQAAQMTAQSALASGAMTKDELQTQIAAISQLPYDQQRQQLLAFKQTASALGPRKEHAKDSTETDMFGEQTYSNIIAPPQKAEADIVYTGPDGIEHNVTFDEKSGHYLYEGRDVSKFVHPKTPPKPHEAPQLKPELTVKGSVGGVDLTGRTPAWYPEDNTYRVDSTIVPSNQIVKAPKEKDPLALALEQERLDKMRRDAAPIDISARVQHSVLGGIDMPYLDKTQYEKEELPRAEAAAEKSGITVVPKEVAEGISAADTASINLDNMWNKISPFLATSAGGRLKTGTQNTLDKIFQTNPTMGSYLGWRTTAVEGIQALAQRGMGLRINKNEIDSWIAGLPLITDDVATAQAKLNIIGDQLRNKVKLALTLDKSGMAVPGGLITHGATAAPPATTSGLVNVTPPSKPNTVRPVEPAPTSGASRPSVTGTGLTNVTPGMAAPTPSPAAPPSGGLVNVTSPAPRSGPLSATAVAAALSNAKVGRYRMTDGTTWSKNADGSVTKQ